MKVVLKPRLEGAQMFSVIAEPNGPKPVLSTSSFDEACKEAFDIATENECHAAVLAHDGDKTEVQAFFCGMDHHGFHPGEKEVADVIH